MSALFSHNRTFRATVIFTVTCFSLLVFFIVYGMLLIRPDHIAEKQDVAAAAAQFDGKLKASDLKSENQHKEFMSEIRKTRLRQEAIAELAIRNSKEVRRVEQRVK